MKSQGCCLRDLWCSLRNVGGIAGPDDFFKEESRATTSPTASSVRWWAWRLPIEGGNYSRQKSLRRWLILKSDDLYDPPCTSLDTRPITRTTTAQESKHLTAKDDPGVLTLEFRRHRLREVPENKKKTDVSEGTLQRTTIPTNLN